MVGLGDGFEDGAGVVAPTPTHRRLQLDLQDADLERLHPVDGLTQPLAEPSPKALPQALVGPCRGGTETREHLRGTGVVLDVQEQAGHRRRQGVEDAVDDARPAHPARAGEKDRSEICLICHFR